MHDLDTILADQTARWNAMTDAERKEETFAWWDTYPDECERLRYTSKNLILDLILDRTRRRHSALAEQDAIDAEHRRVVFNMQSTDAELDDAEAKHDAATAAWHARYDSLWPDDEMEATKKKFEEEQREWNKAMKKTGADAPKYSHEYNVAVAHEIDNNSSRDGVGFLDFWCYSPTRQFIFIPTGEMWSAATIDNRLPRLTRGKTNEGKDIKVSASTALTQFRSVDQATWMPGMPAIIKDKLISLGGWFDRADSRVFNLYKPPTLEHLRGRDVSPWLKHVQLIYPNEWQHIVAWLAHRVQRPGEKINHALVLGGPQGIGKDTLLQPVAQAVGPWNCCEISPRVAVGRFNGFVKSVILRISEARDRGDAADQFEFYEATKTYIAAPPDVIRCDEKNLKEYMVPNVMGVVLTTNNKDGLYLPADDRRHFVCWSNSTKEDFTALYWNRLWGWFAGDGYGIVAHYLANYDLRDFDPKAPPPKTDAFWAMVDISRPSEDAEMADAIDALGTPDAITLPMVMTKAATGFADWLRDRKNRRNIGHRFDACKYVPVRNPDDKRDGQWKINGKRVTVYAKKTLVPRDQIAAVQRLTMAPPPY